MITNWLTQNVSYVLKCAWLNVRKDIVRLPSGKVIPDFYVVEIPDWVNVIAITNDGKVILEQQYRHGIGRVCYELPGGIVDSREDPMIAAKRELEEETGYTGGDWRLYSTSVPNASGSNNFCFTFLATDVKKTEDPRLEDTENILAGLYDWKEIVDIMLKGYMPEGVMQAPLWRFLFENSVNN